MWPIALASFTVIVQYFKIIISLTLSINIWHFISTTMFSLSHLIQWVLISYTILCMHVIGNKISFSSIYHMLWWVLVKSLISPSESCEVTYAFDCICYMVALRLNQSMIMIILLCIWIIKLIIYNFWLLHNILL